MLCNMHNRKQNAVHLILWKSVKRRNQLPIWATSTLYGQVNKYILTETGGRLNKKDGLTRYGNSHVKDKTS